jgi:uncharacterized protein YbaR (Trm112 family)
MSLGDYLWGWRWMNIKPGDLVLEVGSGNRPYARSDVLCDLGHFGQEARYSGTSASGLTTDRPFVFGDAHVLPFRDNAFDYLICSHTLEHLPDPERFLKEAARVSSRGCILTPSRTFELMIAEVTHLWYLEIKDGRLCMEAKAESDNGPFGLLFQNLWPQSAALRKLILKRPDVFEVRYSYENSQIDYSIEGQARAEREVEDDDHTIYSDGIKQLISKLKSLLGQAVRNIHSKKEVDWNAILACPVCHSDISVSAEIKSLLRDRLSHHSLLLHSPSNNDADEKSADKKSADKKNIEQETNNILECGNCGRRYPILNGLPVMLEDQATIKEAPKVELDSILVSDG